MKSHQRRCAGILKSIALLGIFSVIACNSAQKKTTLTPDAPASTPTAQGELIRHSYGKGEVIDLCSAAIQKAQKRSDVIAQTTASSRTIESTLLAFENALGDLDEETTPLVFMSYVSTNEQSSKEGTECNEKSAELMVSLFTRKDLYQAIHGQKPRNKIEARLYDEIIKEFERNGLNLSDEKLAEVKKLKTELTVLESQFGKNLSLDNSVVEFTPEELEGANTDFLGRLKKSSDGMRLIVTTKSTDYLAVMSDARKPETRKKMLTAYVNRAATINTPLLEKAILLRQSVAKIMNYKTWVDYRIFDRMAKDSETVEKFLNGLKSKLAERNKKDKARLLAFKKKLDSSATQLDQWDGIYLETQIKKSDYSIDENIVKEYFPSDFTIRGMLDIYSKLFGVRFEQILNPQAWNGDVSLYKMMDQKSKNLIGYIYMDLFPRPNKYGHAAAFTLVSGRNKADGTYNVPISAIVANLNPPTADKPSLLSHDEVETMFHEFGHIMHQTLTRAPYVDLTGMKMAWDFVEAPSQMLENWVWNKGILTKLSGHYTDTRKKFPQKLLNQMLAAKDFNKGYSYTRQLWLGLMDFTFHTRSGPIDVTETANQLYREINGSEPLPGNHFPATFGHLMGGYDSGYYGYLWSEVFAQDMFTRFEGQNILSPKVGARYRKLVLEPGNTKPAMDLLVDFLGRKPNNRAFFKKLKIN